MQVIIVLNFNLLTFDLIIIIIIIIWQINILKPGSENVFVKLNDVDSNCTIKDVKALIYRQSTVVCNFERKCFFLIEF